MTAFNSDPHLAELKKQTAIMAQNEASKMAAGGLILGIILGGMFWGVAGALALPIPLSIAFYVTTYRKHTKD